MSYESPPPPPGGYQPDPYGGASQRPTSTMAIISLITGIIGIPCGGWFIFSIAAIILGILAMNEIKSGAKTGYGMAVAGLVCGVVGIVIGVVLTILILSGQIDIYANFN